MTELHRPCDRATTISRMTDLDGTSALIRPWACVTPLLSGPVEAANTEPYTTMLLIQARSSGDHWHITATGHGVHHTMHAGDLSRGITRTLHLDTVLDDSRPRHGQNLILVVCSLLCQIVLEQDGVVTNDE